MSRVSASQQTCLNRNRTRFTRRNAMSRDIVTWVEGLKGIAGVVIVFNHLRMCFWPETHDAISESGQSSWVQIPFLSLVCAGNLAVRLYFVLSGFALCYRPLRLLEEERVSTVYDRTSQSLQSRFWRLLVPSAIASAISLCLASLGAFSHSKSICRAFSDTTPTPTALLADLWLWTKDSFLNMWVLGHHHFHDSLWCMRTLLVGSYLMYLLVILRATARHTFWLWAAISCALLSPAVAAVNSTDLSSFVFGGIMAFVEANKAAVQSDNLMQTSLKQSVHYGAWFVMLLLSLFLGSYPSGDANAPWCLWMHALVKLFGISNPRHIMIWWMNVSSFFICLCISKLPWAQSVLSLRFVLYLGSTSFALFLVHPLILRSAGGHVFSVLHQAGLGYDSAALTMGLAALVLSLVASHFWRTYVEIKAHRLVEKYLIMRTDSGPTLVK